jgi:uncharacterized protein (TIGR02246 family)
MSPLAAATLLLALAGGDGRDDVAAAEKKRFAAMIAGDLDTLGALLADDLTYVHSSGRVDSKAQFLDSLRTGRQKYFEIAPEDTSVRVFGDTAVSTGRSAMHVSAGGQDMRFRIQFTDVWVRRNGRWQMVAWQSTRLPEPSPAP